MVDFLEVADLHDQILPLDIPADAGHALDNLGIVGVAIGTDLYLSTLGIAPAAHNANPLLPVSPQIKGRDAHPGVDLGAGVILTFQRRDSCGPGAVILPAVSGIAVKVEAAVNRGFIPGAG